MLGLDSAPLDTTAVATVAVKCATPPPPATTNCYSPQLPKAVIRHRHNDNQCSPIHLPQNHQSTTLGFGLGLLFGLSIGLG
jgi:hypothetical protein